MITFIHPPPHRDPDGPPVVHTVTPFLAGQPLRRYLKEAGLMWLRRSHSLRHATTHEPVTLAGCPTEGAAFRFVPGGKKRM